MGQYDDSPIDFASVLEAVPQPIAVCDTEGEVLFLNAMARLFLEVREDDDLPQFALSRRDTFSQVRIEHRGADIKEYFLADVRITGAGRSQASMSLASLGDDHYRVMLESSPGTMVAPILDELDALVAICDSRRKVRLSNAALSGLMDHAGEGERDLLELFHEDDRANLRVAAAEALAGGMPEEIDAMIGAGMPDGCEKVRVRIRPLSSDDLQGSSGQRGFLMVAQPGKSSFVELQKRFARAEELMSLGELATGVAHELKNPLTSILNYAGYLKKKYRGQFIEQRDSDRLQRIIDGVERIDRFVRDLLHLAGAETLEVTDIELHAALRGAVALSRHALDENSVEVVYELADQEIWVRGHEGGLQQVFSNLLFNAAQAMPKEGGVVTIYSSQEGGQALIKVSDTAGGMSDETREKIFEPFFSTSRDGKGAGLGLALVRRIVDQHDGSIEVESTLGEGSCFTLYLPT